MRIKNRKTIRNLSDKSFQAARMRNGIAILAIALTAILFTSLFTIGLGTIESFQYMTARQAGGDAHGSFKYLSQAEYEKLKTHPLIKDISYNRIISDSVDNSEFLKRHVELYQMDEVGRKISFIHLPKDQVPKKADDIAMDTNSLDLLGVPHKIGEKITLQMTVYQKRVTREFTLCGYWESDPLLNVGFGLVSPAYCEKYAKELNQEDAENPEYSDTPLTGSINAYVNFHNTWNLQKKLDKVITDSGYSTDSDSEKYISSNANWAYMSTNIEEEDPITLAAIIGVLGLIMLTGYLIIYNIFQISVIRDIRFYGLIKTIGTTGKQIKAMIRRQAMQLCLGGIPIGLLIGFFIGKSIVPKIMASTSYRLEEGKVSVNPLIFIGAAIFTILTVLISVRKPGKIAARVSPVEAVRYTETEKYKRKTKKSSNGGKIFKMALSNLGRNKKKTVLVFLSMSLSLILLNSVFTISRGFDMNKYLAVFVDTDFLIGSARYFGMDRYIAGDDESERLSETFIENVEAQPGFTQGGRWYLDGNIGLEGFDFSGYEEKEYGYTCKTEEGIKYTINVDQKGRALTFLYGADDFPLSRLDLCDSDISKEELKEKLDSGKYILEGVDLDDNGKVQWDTAHFKIGDKVTLVNRDTEEKQTFEVLAHVKQHTWTNTNRMFNPIAFYTSKKGYEKVGDMKRIMTYAYNCEEHQEKAMADFLKNYTENVEPTMNYETKFDKEDQFKQFQMLFIGVGGALSLLIGLIGILNFVNSILTGIITRRREFAMLESIGMTKKQLTALVVTEGLYYGGGTAALSLAGGILVSTLLVRKLLGVFWFFRYKLIIWPLLAAIPLVLLLGILAPYLSRKMAGEGSLVERLRETE